MAITLFVSTNVDDLVVLVGFFADRRYRARHVVFGQYAGLAVLFLVSAGGSLLSLVIPGHYLRFMGLFPILIGIRKLLELRHPEASALQPELSMRGAVATVALVTLANGGDNIGIYLPAFAVRSASQIAVIAIVFVAMTALWCGLAYRMVTHPSFGAPFRRYAHLVAPLLLIAIGIAILYKN